MRGPARERLLLREEQLWLIQQMAPIGIAMVELDGTFASVNPALCRILGMDAEDLVGRTFQEITHPDDLDRDLAYVRQLLAGEIETYEMEKRYFHADGHTVWIHLTGSLLRQVDGSPLQFVAHIRDISGERRQRLVLEREVEDRTAELRTANEELQAFAYSVSHDLRAPLRALDGFSQALREDYGDVLEGDGQDFLRRIESNVQRMAGLIDDMLKLSRVSRQVMEIEPVDLAELARDLIRELRELHPEREVRVVVPESLPAHGDPDLVRILLWNLLDNAWKFTRNETEPLVELHAGSGPEGEPGWVVEDNGAGFDMAYADKLFQAFQRLHLERDFEGTGVGLATVARIARRHGGSVHAEGKPGEGARIWFSLGRSPEEGGGVAGPGAVSPSSPPPLPPAPWPR